MKLRTLQTIDGLGSGPVNTVIMFPVEVIESIKLLGAVLAHERNGVATEA
jgi:hypothetical protein